MFVNNGTHNLTNSIMSHLQLIPPTWVDAHANDTVYGVNVANNSSSYNNNINTIHHDFRNGNSNNNEDMYFEELDEMGRPVYKHGESMLMTATALTIGLAVFGATGNILTVLAILTSRLRNNINSILICNLSLAGSIYCSVVLPLQAMAFYNKSWTLTETLCEFHAALRIGLIGIEMLLLSAIALYRFLHVVQPQYLNKFKQAPWLVSAIIFCWLFPLIFSFTPLVNWWGQFAFQGRILQCTFGVHGSKSHKIITVTLGYVVPCVFLCTCYARIGCVVARTRNRASRGSIYRKQRARRESLRMTAMMVLIFLGFLIGTTPFFIINTLDSKLKYPLPHIWLPFLAWFMYGLNPIIYTVMDVQFQQAYKRLILCGIFSPEPTLDMTAPDRQTSLLKSHRVDSPTEV